MKNEMKKTVAGGWCLVLGALCLMLGAGSAWASNQSTSITMFVGETQVQRAPDNVAGSGNSTTGWSQSSNTNPNVAEVTPANSSGGALTEATRRPYAKIVAKAAGSTTYVMKNDKDNYTWTISITVKAPIEKTLKVDEKQTFNSTAQVPSGYYKFVYDTGADTYVTATPTAATRTNSKANVSLSLTGKAVTTSPVTVRLQQSSSQDGTYTDLEVYSVTVKPNKPSADPVDVPLTEGGKTYTPKLSGAVVSAKSSNVQVAEVDEKTGVIKPMWLGDATVTIEDAEYIRTYNVKVTNTKTTQLNIDFDTESSKALTFPSGEGMYWTVSKDDPDEVIALDKSGQTTAATKRFELKVTPNKTGKATFKVVAEKTEGMTRVKYGDYTYNVWVTATPSGDRQSTATLKVDGDATITCPSKCSETKATWTIKSGYDEAKKAIATLSVVNPDGGTVKPQVKVTKALKPGLIHLVIGNDKDDHTWTLDIVVKKYVVEVLELDTSKDETRVRELTCEGDLAGAWGASSTYESVARAEIVGETTDKTCKVKVIGISEGKTVITVQNEFATYEYTVSVKGEYVPSTEKTVDYTYTDEAGKVQKATIGYEGATVSWAPSADGKNTDLVLTFTNTADISKFEIPSPKIFRARILAVGGGGAGGSQALPGLGGGGGGAGGYMENDNALLSAGYFYVTVGEGGRAAEEKFVASTGMNGGISVVTNSAGQVLASAIGGGGGGASISKAIGGQSGGSGGGGAWVNDFSTTGGNGAGGNGRDGQGHRGGKPADEPENFNNGGGGGGACVTSNKVNGAWVFLGEGGTHGEAGLGTTNDITGVALEYARGGVGGKNNSTAKAASGANGRGNGGAGGNGGFGGAGGDGIVIIRLTSVFENIQVPKPTVANGGLFTESTKPVDEAISEFEFKDSYGTKGHTFTSFNSDAEVPGLDGKTYGDIVKYVDGCQSTNAWLTVDGGTNVYHNIGHFQYVVYLKDGYSWIDGSPYGSTSGCLIDWRIAKDLRTVDATIRVEKSVSWAEDGSNAVITITSHSTPQMNPITPKVLFLGSLCNAHGLTAQTIYNSLNAISRGSDVDYYLYKVTNKNSDPYVPQLAYSGSLKKGEEISSGFELDDTMHSTMGGFYSTLKEVFENPATSNLYDYIVFEFDGSRIAYRYTKMDGSAETESVRTEREAKEAFVSKCLVSYYEKDRVLWITDDKSFAAYPWTPVNEITWSADSSDALHLRDYKALAGLFDPAKYNSSFTLDTKCESNTNQVGYSVSSTVEKFLTTTIKPVAYNLSFNDKIMADVGLSLTGLKFSCATNDLALDSDQWWEMVTWDAANPDVFDRTGEKYWTAQIPKLGSLNIRLTSVDTTSNRVEVTMTNMWIETWAKIDIGLVDDGMFKTSVDATYNSVTGQWEKNPNEGKAAVAMIKEDGTRTEVKGEAATAAAWKFSTYDVTAEAVNGEIFLNGIRTNWTAFCEGYSPIVSYRGKPGYDLVKLYVDTDLYTQGDFNDENRVYTLFSQLAGNHSVRAEYEAYVEEIVDAPSTNTYDAAGHVFPVKVTLAEGADYEIDVRYAFAADKDDPEKYLTATNFCVVNREALKDVGPHEIYYKVFALQQGYGASIDQKGWVEVGVKGREVGGGVNTNWVEAATLYATAGSTYITSKDTGWAITNGDVIAFSGFVTNTVGGVEYAEDATNALDFHDKTAQQCLECKDFISGKTPTGTYPIVITSGAITAKDKTTGVTGNYIIKTYSGTLYVDGVPFVINGKPQNGSEDPEDQNGPIAVKSVSKVYDGNPTSIVLRVDFPEDFPSDDPQYKSVFKFAWSEECPGEGDWQDTLPEFTNVVTKAKVWYLLEDTRCRPAITNYAYVTIEPRPVTLNSPNASKEFDGNALHTTDEQCWISEDTPLVKGDEIKMRNVTWQTTVTTEPVSNKFTYEFTKGDPNNYKVTVNEGGLTVTKGGLTIGRPGADREDEDYPVKYPIDQNPRLRPPVATNGVASVVKTYDGQPTNITVYAFNPKNGNLPVEGLVYLYTTNANDAASWKPTLGLTDVTGEDGAGVGVWFSINDPQGNWASVTNMAFVTILPKAATVTAASAEKTYDGEELVEGGYKADGFIEGEGVKSVTMTADSRIINAGTTNNVIDVIEPLAGTKLTNYAITKVPGVLKINPKPLTLHSRDKSETYQEKGKKVLKVEAGDIWDGTPELKGTADDDYYVDGECFAYGDFAAVTNNKIQVAGASFAYADNGKALVSNYIVTEDFGFLTIGGTTIHIGGKDTKDGEEPGDPWVKPVDVFYNGKGHAIEVDVTYPVDTSSLKFHYKSEATGGEWVDWNPQYTNVTGRAIEVWYAVDDTTPGRFASVTNCSTVTVRPRPITVKANDQTMTYGKDIPDLADQFTVSNRVDDTYSVTLKYTNDVFNAGVCTNAIVTNAAITVTHPTLGDVTADYDITFLPGTLTVKKGAAPEYDVTSVTNVFNYKGTNVTVTAEDGNEIWWKVNGVWTRTPPAYTNVLWTHSEVDSYKVEFKVVDPSGNYEDAFGTGEVVINPLPITVTAESFTKTLGAPMPEFGWVETIDGTNPPERIPEEDRNRLTISVDPDCHDLIPDGLDSTNYVIHVSGNRAQGNYIITYVDGTLTVTRKKRFGYKKLGAEVMYDGLGHRIEVVVTNEELVARANYGYSMTQLPADSKDWKSLEEMQAVTNASSVAGSPIYFRIMIDDGSEYETEIGNATVKVLPRPVMLKAADGEWPQDGEWHGTNGFEVVTNVVGYTNFVYLSEEHVEGLKSVTMTGDSRIKEIGTTNNVIASVAPNDVTKLSNYTFAYSNGVLRVTEGRKPMPLKPIDPVEVYYDGEGHMYKPQFDWEEGKEPEELTITYSVEEDGEYTEGLEATNVVESGTYYFKATAKGYFDTNGWSTVTINKRTVQLKSQSGSWEYDGKGHGTNEVFEVEAYDAQGGHGFVPGEGVTTNSFAEVTNVVDTATGNNTFKYELTEKTSKDNYTIDDSVYGDLAITPYTNGYKVVGVTNAVYTGKAYEPRPEVWATNVVDKLLLVETNDYTLVWVNNTNATDNTESKVAFVEITMKGNYAGVVTQKFEIARAPVTVKGNMECKKAHGKPDPEADFIKEISGLVNGESESLISYNAKREEGEDVGTYTIFVTADEIQGNYEVETKDGELQILDRDIKVKAEDIVYVYNGTETNPVVTVQNPGVKDDKTVIEFFYGDDWRTTAPTFRDVVPGMDHRTNITFRVNAEDDEGPLTEYVGSLVVSIQPRTIALKMGNGNNQELAKQKVYDGTPLWGTEDDIQVGGLGYAPGEKFIYGGFTNRIEVGINPSGFNWRDNPDAKGTAGNPKGTLVSNYKVEPEYGWLKILPPENAITIYSANAIWEYDGKAHPYDEAETNKYYHWWLDESSQLKGGDRVVVDEKSWSATLTTKGLVLNNFDFKIMRGEIDVTDQYKTIKAAGTFEMKNGTITGVVGHSTEIVYNGQPTNAWVEITNETVNDNDPKIFYSTDKANWSEENPEYTHVTGEPVYVWYAVEAKNFTAITNVVPISVNILPRPVEFESLDIVAKDPASIPNDDEQPLTVVTNGEYGVVAGDVFAFTPTNKLSAVGEAPAAFRWDAPTQVSNDYTVALKYGQLVVTDGETLVVRAMSKEFTFDGKSNTCHEVEVVAKAEGDTVTLSNPLFTDESFVYLPTKEGEYVANKVTNVTYTSGKTYADVKYLPGKLTMKPAKFTDVTIVTTNVVYDGKEYWAEAFTSVEGAKIAYNTSGSDALYWADKPKFRNADESGYPVYIQVTAKGYEPYYGMTSVFIRPRPLTLYSVSATNVYNGAEFTTSNRTDAVWAEENPAEGTGLVKGDKLAHTRTVPVLTDAAQVANSFIYEIHNDEYPGQDLAANYYVTPMPGRLVVTPYEFELKLSVNDKVYDGYTNATFKASNLENDLELPVPGDGTKTATDVLALNWDAIGEELKFFFEDPSAGANKPVTNNVFKDSWVITNRPDVVRNNYAITKVTVENAAITPAEIKPQNPPKGKDVPPKNPTPEKPWGENDGAKNPEPQDPEVPTLWAPDIAKVYDGKGTNTAAKVYGAFGAYDFTYEYSTNNVDFFPADQLQLTNVLKKADGTIGSYLVYCRAKDGKNNYVATNCFAWVTILPKVVDPEDGVQAKDATMTYGKYGTLTPLTDQWYTLLDEGVLEDGDGIASVSLAYTNDVKEILERLPVVEGGYEGFVSTNKKVAVAIVITNATGDISANYRMGFLPGKLVISKDKPTVDPIKDDDDRIYDGTEQKPLTPGMVKTSEGDEIPEDEYKVEYHYNVHATNRTETSGAYVVVTFTNNYDAVVTNYFSINRRPVWFKTPDHEFTYSGEAQSNRAVTVEGKGFVKAVDREVADGIVTNGFKAITTVSESGADAEFFYVLAEGTLESDYEIRKPEWGTLTMVSAPTEPKTPPEEREPPEDPTPENPGDTEAPDEDKGKAVLWAPDVAKYYDGKGTNTEAQVYFAKPGGYGSFTYEYTTNEDLTGWAENVLFTNVLTDAEGNVIPYKVYCRAVDGEGNYVTTNYLAYVTILPKVVDPEDGVQAKDATMTYGKYETLTKLTDQWYTLLNEGVLEDGDGIKSVQLAYTNDVEEVLEKLPVVEGGYAGFVSTNRAPETGCAIVITNATGDVSANYRMGFLPGKLTIGKLHPEGTQIQAEDITIAYGEDLDQPTHWKWTDGNGLVNDDEIGNVPLWFTNGVDVSRLDAGIYEKLISTNGIITVTNKMAGVDVTGNYELDFLPGILTITNAVITPKGPFGPGGGDPPGPDAGYPWVGATNVVMEYTGTNGTNVVVCWGGLKPPTLQPESILYTTNLESDVWSADLQFTNVFYDVAHDNCVTSQQVWFAVTFRNYDVITNSAFVTILPKMMWFGPDGDGEIHPQDPANPPPPNDPYDDSGTSNGVRNVVAEYYEGISTNIIVNVVRPDMTDPSAGVEILYSTNKTTWVEWDALQFEEPILTQKVWYAVSAPNYQTITNYGYVTIYKYEGKKSDRSDPNLPPLDPNTSTNLTVTAEDDEGSETNSFVKIQLTIASTNRLDETTRTSPEMAAEEAAAIIREAEEKGGEKVVYSKFYDIILERTYDLAVAMSDYDWHKWEDIGDAEKHHLINADRLRPLYTIVLPFDVTENTALMGVWVSHTPEGGEVVREPLPVWDGSLDEDGNEKEGYTYDANARTNIDGVAMAYVTVHVRNFSIYGILLKEATQDALFGATLGWKYYSGTGSYFANLTVWNSNTLDRIRYDKGTLRFCFADRTNATGRAMLALGDSWTGGYVKTNETIKGVTYRVFPLEDFKPDAEYGGWTEEGASKSYGPGESRPNDDNINGTPEMFVYKRIAPEWGNEEAAWATNFVAWLVWDWTNPSTEPKVKTTYAIPLLATKDGAAKVATPKQAVFVGGPISVSEYNEVLAFGVRENLVTGRILNLKVEDGRGEIGVGFENTETGALIDPGPNVRVIVQGAEDLGGPFEDMGELKTEDGTAEFGLQGKQFFKVKAEALPVVK